MAASQSLTEGLPPKPSFADMVRGTPDTTCDLIKEPSLHKGEPALHFSDPEVAALSTPLRFALIGKFTSDRPSMEFLRRGFKTIGFKGDFRLGLMDHKHILIRFDLEEDYHRCWLHSTWRFKDHVMKVLKWTSDFSVKEEPPIVPVWISLEQLPLFLYARAPLFSIGRIFGNPLKLDAATISLSRPSVARLCVEVDLRHPLPNRIWIGLSQSGFWQPITYEHLPDYCFDCHSLGHPPSECGQQVPSKEKQVWRIKSTQPGSVQTSPPQADLPPAANTSGLSSAEKYSIPVLPSAIIPRSQAHDLPVPPPDDDVAPQSQALGHQPHAQQSQRMHATVPLVASHDDVPPVASHDDVPPANDPVLSHDDVAPQSETLGPLAPSTEVVDLVDQALQSPQHLHDTVHAVVSANTIQPTQTQIPPTQPTVSPPPQSSGLTEQRAATVPEDSAGPEASTAAVIPALTPAQPVLSSDVYVQGHADSEADVGAYISDSAVPQHEPLPTPAGCVTVPFPLSPAHNLTQLSCPLQPSFLQATYKQVLVDNSLQGMLAQEIGFPPTAIESAPEHNIVVYQSDGQAKASNFAATCSALPLGKSPILQLPHSQNRWPPALDTDFGYNDSDYYQDTLGSDALGHDDYEDTDDHSYDDITDGSEGTHMKKKKDRRKLKGLVSTPTATIDDFTAQSRLIDMRIRKRGRPPGSRNRTFFDVQRTMSTRATKATSD